MIYTWIKLRKDLLRFSFLLILYFSPSLIICVFPRKWLLTIFCLGLLGEVLKHENHYLYLLVTLFHFGLHSFNHLHELSDLIVLYH